MPVRCTSPAFVGRERELAALTTALDDAAAGAGTVAVVSGEAGVGKTRLVDELLARAAAEGTRTVVGGCLQLGDAGLPLSPVIDVLRTLLAQPDADAVVGPATSVLATLLPDLGPPTAADTSTARLHEAVLGVVQRAARPGPMVVVLEDLHWADRSTLDLVAVLSRAVRRMPVLMVLTYRADEVHRRHPLRAVLSEAERSRGAVRLPLDRFDEAELAALLTGIRGTAPDRELLDVVRRWSEGNAFLAEEVVAMLADDPSALPRSLTTSLGDLLLTRVDRLGPAARRVVELTAVAGGRVPHRLLGAVDDSPDPELLTALREAVEAAVLVPDEPGAGYAFRHALVREAVYDDALPGERVRLHRRIAEVLARDPGLMSGAGPSELAHHWYAAHDLPRALAASLAAADVVEAAYGHAEALALRSRALELWPQVPADERPAGIDHLGVLEAAARAAHAAGDVERALGLAAAGLEEAGDADPVRVALLLERKAKMLSDLGRPDDVEELERAVRLLGDTPSPERALVLGSLAAALMLQSRFEESVRVADVAVTAASRAGAFDAKVHALSTLGTDLVSLGRVDEGLARLREAVSTARTTPDAHNLVRSLVNLSDALEGVGQYAEAVTVAAEGHVEVRRVGQLRGSGAFVVGNQAFPLFALGRWDEAEQLVREALELQPVGVPDVILRLAVAEVDVARGRWDDALEHLAAASTNLSSGYAGGQYRFPLRRLRAEALAGRGDLDAALEVVDDVLRSDVQAGDNRHLWPLLATAARLAADAVQAARDRAADTASAATRLGVVADHAARLPAPVRPSQAWREETGAELERGEGSATAARWLAVADAWAEVGWPQRRAEALLRAAEAGASADRTAAAQWFGEALQAFERLGAAPAIERAGALARRARFESVPAQRDPQEPTSASPLDQWHLTPRETDVLRLVAEGRTNGQIGAELFISTKTASVHVSNLLAKLGVASRVEAAALAHRLRVFEPTSAPAGPRVSGPGTARTAASPRA
jgi:DNA-binding CsgD family transcriptional regulator/tetratricopeptide (TPR) repeat protein